MNTWRIAAIALSIALIPCADMCLRGSPEKRLVGLEMTNILVTILLVILTVVFGRAPFIDLPLALAIMGFGSGLVYIRFLGKHL